MKFSSIHAASTPSVKGIYFALFLMLFTTFAYAQKGSWELGIGLRPLTIKEDPYSFIAKKYLSDKTALRIGMGGLYKSKNENFRYVHPYTDTIHRLVYEYAKTFKNFDINSFIGLQYGKQSNSLNFYCSTDLTFNYSQQTELIPAIFHSGITNLVSNDFFITGNAPKYRTIAVGIRQSLGLVYNLNQQFSLSIEGGVSYKFINRKKEDFFFFTSAYNGLPGGIGSQIDVTKNWNYELLVSPLSMIIFYYHF